MCVPDSVYLWWAVYVFCVLGVYSQQASVFSILLSLAALVLFTFLARPESSLYITFVWWQMQLRTFLPASPAAESENKDSSKSPFCLCLLPFPSSVTCLLLPSSISFHSQSRCHCYQLMSKTLVRLSFFPPHICSISPFFPLRRLTESVLRVRKQTQIILGALPACDRGLASRFKWEHMEIITTNWHELELVCPPGEKNEALHSLHHCNNHLSDLSCRVSGQQAYSYSCCCDSTL